MENIQSLKKQVKDYKQLQKTLSEEVYSLPSSTAKATKELKLNEVRKEKQGAMSNLKKAQWYSDDSKSESKSKTVVSRTLDALTAPGYAVSGAVEFALGKGDKKTVIENIVDQVKKQEGYSTLLKKYGANNAVALPVGFALDIAMDPVSWLSGGSSTLVGRGIEGAAKAGTKGAAKGLASRGLELASTVSKPLKYVAPGKVSSLAEKAATSTDDYFKMTHGTGMRQTVEDLLKRSSEDRMMHQAVFRKAADKFAEKFPRANKVVSAFKSDKDWFKTMKQKEADAITEKAVQDTGLDAQLFEGKVTDEFYKRKNAIESMGGTVLNKQQVGDLEKKIRMELGSGMKLASGDYSGRVIPGFDYLINPERAVASKLGDVSASDIQNTKELLKIIIKDSTPETGIKWYDDARKSVKASALQGKKAYKFLNALSLL